MIIVIKLMFSAKLKLLGHWLLNTQPIATAYRAQAKSEIMRLIKCTIDVSSPHAEDITHGRLVIGGP